MKRTAIIYGGEPLLNREVTHQAIEYLRAKFTPEELSIQMLSNGTMMTPETAQVIANNNVNVALSIDGTREVTNRTRPFRHETGDTYEKLRNAWRMLTDAGSQNPSISLTLSKYNVPNLRRQVQALNEEFSPASYGFNFLLGQSCDLNDCEIDIAQATTAVIDTFKYLREQGIPEDRMMRKIRDFAEKKPHLKDCGGIGNQIVISADGYVGACQGFATSKEYFIPLDEAEKTDLKTHPIFQEGGSRYPLNLEDCVDCLAVSACGGGCPYQGYLMEGDIRKMDERMCEHNKTVVDWMIKETIRAKEDGNT